MHPPISIILFTVLSGSGLGLAIYIAAFAPLLIKEESLTLVQAQAIGGGAFVAVALGLCASVGHLANPKNAWRAFMRVRTSWLSREAVAAVLFFAALVAWFAFPTALITRAAVILLALATIVCTAMIYQSLKPIPQWHHPLTTCTYLAFALLNGGVWFLLATAYFTDDKLIAHSPIAILYLLSLIATVFAKIASIWRVLSLRKTTTTARAIGSQSRAARLLDAGHTGKTFLTKEFIYNPSEKLVERLRLGALVSYMNLPLALMLPMPWWLMLTLATILLAAILVDRWLFFAEARHTIRAYH